MEKNCHTAQKFAIALLESVGDSSFRNLLVLFFITSIIAKAFDSIERER
jgi:hypothetical protein